MKASVHAEYRDEADHWWFAARRAIFASVLAVRAPDARGPVLDLGPGHGVNADVLLPRGAWLPLDREHGSLAACRSHGPCRPIRADASHLPVRGGSIGLLAALDVLEHLDDDEAALRSWREALAADGTLLLSVPAFRVLWGRQDVLAEHRRRYRAAELRKKLERAGLAVTHLSYFNTLLFPPILLVRLLSRPFLSRSVRAGRSDLSMRLPLVDGLLERTFALERHVVPRLALPFGVSLLAVARPRP